MKNNSKDSKIVLVIEDDFDLLWLISKLLHFHGYKVLTAVTASQGLDFFSRNAFKLNAVILDLTLPDASGEELAEEILKVFPEMPIIITTGEDDIAQKNALLNKGVKAYLVKPFDLNSLITILTTL
ncbi:MAG: response regulator [Calditrichaeota bacterium]|nr:MAG: response regulator [Calditrichota bacterium]